MPNIFIISDTHFGHQAMCEFIRDDGSKVRPFLTCNQCDDLITQNWNKIIKPKDKVYHLGDVAIKKQHISTLEKLNGEKILLRGNHDIFTLNEYAKYFKDIRATHKLDKFILSHYPIHPESIPAWCKGNIHGHLHYRKVLLPNNQIDCRYTNVCVECTDYKPIPLEELKSHIALSQ
jgi:calcineurin-like phosphoesterase family protein